MLSASRWLVRTVRSAREFLLRIAYSRRGMVRVVNDTRFHVLPEHRSYFTSEYDQPVAQYFRDRVRPGAVCVSVGANMGIYPLQFAHWSSPTGRVYAFEPNPQTAAVLRRHLTLNHVADRVEVFELAVSEAPGEAIFHAIGVDGMSRLGEPNPALVGRTVALKVRVDSLDHFFGVAGVQPDALMMDVEGFEILALRGARTIFGKPFPAVVIELHPKDGPGSEKSSPPR